VQVGWFGSQFGIGPSLSVDAVVGAVVGFVVVVLGLPDWATAAVVESIRPARTRATSFKVNLQAQRRMEGII